LRRGETVLWPPEEGDLADGERIRLGLDRGDGGNDAAATAATGNLP
jgi:hypothetical protein